MKADVDSAPVTAPVTRRVWAWADAHIGAEADGLDGAQWLELAAGDIKKNLPPVDFIVSLGDLTNNGLVEQLDRYKVVRDSSGIGPWYEMLGNHDRRAFREGTWSQYVSLPGRAVLLDGNLVWILLSVEFDGAAGRLSPGTFQWLHDTIALYQDRNIIVCTHQPVYDSVNASKKEARCLFRYEYDGREYEHGRISEEEFRRVERMLEELRVDLWLCCHAHSGPRDAGWAAMKGRTQVVNIASISHNYGTNACRSFVLEMTEGSDIVELRSRNHDKACFEPEFGVKTRLLLKWVAGSKPALVNAVDQSFKS